MANFIKNCGDWLIWLGDWLFEPGTHAWQPYVDVETGFGFIFLIFAFGFTCSLMFSKKLRDMFF